MQMRKHVCIALTATFLASLPTMVAGQYTVDMSDDAESRPHIRYFGSAKDNGGRRLPDVTILIESRNSNFIFLSDQSGRFSGALPIAMKAPTVSARCVRRGYQTVRVTKRASSGGGKSSVQVDCILKRSA